MVAQNIPDMPPDATPHMEIVAPDPPEMVSTPLLDARENQVTVSSGN